MEENVWAVKKDVCDIASGGSGMASAEGWGESFRPSLMRVKVVRSVQSGGERKRK